jgi:hypothetical protein
LRNGLTACKPHSGADQFGDEDRHDQRVKDRGSDKHPRMLEANATDHNPTICRALIGRSIGRAGWDIPHFLRVPCARRLKVELIRRERGSALKIVERLAPTAHKCAQIRPHLLDRY